MDRGALAGHLARIMDIDIAYYQIVVGRFGTYLRQVSIDRGTIFTYLSKYTYLFI